MSSAATDRFVARASAAGVDVEPTAYPAGTRTAADAAAAIGCDVAQIVKSLVFMADDRPLLALTSGANRVDEAALAATAGATTVRKASADEVRTASGYAIGGTPPFAHDNPIPTYLDPDLMAFNTVWAAAGTPSHCFPITPDALRAAAGATVARFTTGPTNPP